MQPSNVVSTKEPEQVPPMEQVPNRRLMDPARALTTRLPGQLLGQDLGLDLYIQNGFRLLGLPAQVSNDELERASNRVLARARLGGAEAVARGAIRTGYEERLPLVKPEDRIARLSDPRHRLCSELFWPHLEPDLFAVVRNSNHIASADAMKPLAGDGKNGGSHVLLKHALAVAWHNRAIEGEMAFLDGTGPRNPRSWAASLSLWGEVLRSDEFWGYVAKRITCYDDFRVRPEDLPKLRDTLPSIVLGFNVAFAQLYAQAGESETCAAHAMLIRGSGLPPEAVNNSMRSAVQSMADTQMMALIRKMNESVMRVEKRLARRTFSEIVKPVVAQALDLSLYLKTMLNLKDDEGLFNFDDLCQLVVDATNKKADYTTDDSTRTVFLALILCRQMQELPLSSAMRLKIEQEVRENRRLVFKEEFGIPDSLDPSKCWFVDGEWADEEASLMLPMYKITDVNREVLYDRIRTNVRWNERNALIPRSVLARELHQGKVKADDILSKSTNPKVRAIRNEIAKLDERKMVIRGHYQQQLEAALQNQRKKEQEEVNQYARQHEADHGRATAYIAKHTAILDARKKEAAQERQAANTAIDNQYATRLNASQEDFFARTVSIRGFRGLLRYHFALGCAGAATSAGVMGAVAGAGLLNGMPWLASAAGEMGVNPPWLLPVGTAALVGLIVGMAAVGAPLRRRKLQSLRADLTALESEIAEKKSAVDAACANKIREHTATFNEKTRAAQNWLKVYKEKKAAINTRYTAAANAAGVKSEELIAQQSEDCNSKIDALRAQLPASKPKKENAKSNFPGYVNAKSRGYKDGKKPSDWEINNA